MPAPIPDDVRAAILADIQAGDNSCRGIARDHKVSPDTVRRVAREAGIEQPFARAKTKNATAARKADMGAERAIVSALFLRRAREALEQMDQPHLVFNFGGKDNDYNSRTLDKPPTADLRNLMTSAAIAFDKHIVRERFDAQDGAEQVVSLLGTLFDGLRERHGDSPAE